MKKLLVLWSWVRRHKYLITLLAFGIIIGFVGENSCVRYIGYKQEEQQLKEEIRKYQAEYDESTRRLRELDADSGAIEQVAREKYLMKEPDEDIYIFQDDVR